MRNAILTISSAAKTATSGKFGAVLKSTPVSYTHLTLPTIYSV